MDILELYNGQPIHDGAIIPHRNSLNVRKSTTSGKALWLQEMKDIAIHENLYSEIIITLMYNLGTQ